MELSLNGQYTNEVRILLLTPILVLLLLVLLSDKRFILILLPLFMFLLFIENELNSFREIEENITISRSFSKTRVNELNEIKVTLTISNQSDFDSHTIELIDNLPKNFELVNSTNNFLFRIKKREKILLSYKIRSFQIGIYEFEDIYVKHKEVFGLIIENFVYKHDPVSLTITPRLEQFEKVPIFPYWMKYFNGYFMSKQFGNDDDFMGIREFQYGDRLKRINWKASSRFQTSPSHHLFSNFFNIDKAINVEIIIDFTYESEPIYDEIIRAFGSLTQFFLKTRNSIGVTIAKQYAESIETKHGRRQFQTIIDKLLMTSVDFKLNSNIILDRLMNLSTQYNKKSILIVLSPLLNKYIIEYCKKLKSNGFSILVLKINSLEKQLAEISSGLHEDIIPLRIPIFFNIVSFDFMIKNFLTKDKLLAKSIPVLEWNPAHSLKGYLSSQRKKIRI